jgi:hypothetical protein
LWFPAQQKLLDPDLQVWIDLQSVNKENNHKHNNNTSSFNCSIVSFANLSFSRAALTILKQVSTSYNIIYIYTTMLCTFRKAAIVSLSF